MSDSTALAVRGGTIYMLTSPSGKSYVGQTRRSGLKPRLSCHKSPSSGCSALKAAVQKYGWESFKIEVLAAGVPFASLNWYEGFFVSLFGTLSPGGYNIHPGGNAQIAMSSEVKAKISLGNRGKVRTPEMIAAHSAMLRKYWSNPDNRRAQSQRKSGRRPIQTDKARLAAIVRGLKRRGTKASPEAKAKMAISQQARWEKYRANK